MTNDENLLLLVLTAVSSNFNNSMRQLRKEKIRVCRR